MSHGSAIFVYNPASTGASRAGSPRSRAGPACPATTCPVIQCLGSSKLLFNPTKLPNPRNIFDNDDKVEQWSYETLYWYESQWAGTEIVCYCLCKVFPVLAPHPPGPGRQPAGTASIQPQPPALTHRRVFTVLFINTHWHNILYWTGHYLPSRDLFVTIVDQHGQHYNQLDQQLLLLSVIRL